MLQWAINQIPDSRWVCELETNVTFFLNRISDHPIRCVGLKLSAYVKNSKAIIDLEKTINIPRGTPTTYVSSAVWPYIENATYVSWNRQ